MRKNIIIVTTTINKPTEALLKYISLCQSNPSWFLIIVADKKTPYSEYETIIENNKNKVAYLTPELQDEKYPDLSKSLGWNTIQRRNIGFVYAYEMLQNMGITNNSLLFKNYVIATVDDDNIPYDNWGKNVYVNTSISTDIYEVNNYTEKTVFDPFMVSDKYNHMWHRGFPIEQLNKRSVSYKGKEHMIPYIQADLWDGIPDIDGFERQLYPNYIKFDINHHFASNQISVFNSQNTFISAEYLKYYMCLPFVGRMDDIWGAYLFQELLLKYHNIKRSVLYNKPTVYQEREQDVQRNIKDLKNEMLGYEYTYEGIYNMENMLKQRFFSAYKAFEEYQKLFI